ncbi:MAG: class I SAM-dependent methyltransferase [Chloroflexota bacterium]
MDVPEAYPLHASVFIDVRHTALMIHNTSMRCGFAEPGEKVRRRYNCAAPVYDVVEGALERVLYKGWRELAWDRVEGSEILELGVGTGKNVLLYAAGADITAVDISEQMLLRARQRAERLESGVRLVQMDVQSLGFADDSFDTVIGTCVFCSVPDPLAGLKEVARVCRQGGKVVLFEHVLSSKPLTARIMNLLNPPIAWLAAENINRQTIESVRCAGLDIERITGGRSAIFKLIEARKRAGRAPGAVA